MRRFLAMSAAILLLAACETQTAGTGGARGAGGASYAGAGSTSAQQELGANVGDRVFFDLNKHEIRADAQKTLKAQAEWLQQRSSLNITIEGHCDERGTREYNLALGERRANAVKDYLVALGVSANRITTISYGEERPVALGHNDSAWAQNRRGVTKVN
ncbi:MAG: peptidoglycan-associated lipoprotein Pal [Alphaproteobacteria bacterium]|nr:peptidoglycan-associated lipoprotein Pal [Alphaproteobacteria bacterium]